MAFIWSDFTACDGKSAFDWAALPLLVYIGTSSLSSGMISAKFKTVCSEFFIKASRIENYCWWLGLWLQNQWVNRDEKKIQIVFFSFFLFLFHSSSYAQAPVEDENGTSHDKPSIDIFTIYSSEDSSALISLSEIYHLNSDSLFGDEAGSLIIPNITERGFEH